MSLFGGSTNSDTNKSNQDDKPKESGTPAANIAQKDFALLFAKKEEPTAANGEEAKNPEGTEKPNLFGGLFSGAPKSPSKEEKKDESPTKPSGGLFSNQQGGSLFGNLAAGTFTVPPTLGSGLLGGNVTAAPTLGGGLFGNASADPAKVKTDAETTNTETPAATTTGTTTGTTAASPQKAGSGGLFGGGGIFGSNPVTGGGAGGLFAGAGALPAAGSGLFGGAGLGGGLFGNAGASATATTATTGNTGGGGLFAGGATGGLFGGPPGNTGNTGGAPAGAGAGGLFGNKPTGTTTGGGLFGNNSSPSKPAAGGLNLGTLKGNVQYTPNLNAPTTGKTGTVNYDLKFGKSNENYEIYSITCASNADKNKSIEELRAEDYELIRTGELPEALQLKIIDNRERLEKNLGFVLPVPTPSSSNKAYTKVFKSTTRNTSMKSTFMNNKYADVKFKVENEEIPAHRNVLGLCSPFFDDLFTKHQSDTFPLVIEIPNIKAETFRAILEFLYTGEVNLHEDLAVDLILNGSRFDVNDLVQAADDFISKMINIDNYMKVLEISDRLSSKPLRKKVFTFIVRNMKMISKREDFEELPRDFLMEILENAIAA